MIAKTLHVLVNTVTFEMAVKIYSDQGTSNIRLKSMFCPKAWIYSEYCHNISHLGIQNNSIVAEFEFFIYGGSEEEKIKTYLDGFGLEPLEIWT